MAGRAHEVKPPVEAFTEIGVRHAESGEPLARTTHKPLVVKAGEKYVVANDAKTEIMATKAGIMLDLGCGTAKQKHFVGMDLRAAPGVDIVHDLEEFPWPVEDESCLTILASHILEHIKPWKFMDPAARPCVMGEIWRVLKPDGQLLISAPYGVGPGYVQDPTHCNPISEVTLQYFDPRFELYNVYETPFMFTIESVKFARPHFLEAILGKRVEKP